MKLGIAHILVLWIILWLFSLTTTPNPTIKEVVYWVMIVLLIIALFFVGPPFQV